MWLFQEKSLDIIIARYYYSKMCVFKDLFNLRISQKKRRMVKFDSFLTRTTSALRALNKTSQVFTHASIFRSSFSTATMQ